MGRIALRSALLASFGLLLSCGPEGFVMYRGTDVRDGSDDISVVGDRAHDVVRLRSARKSFEIPLPYAEDWEVYDEGKGASAISMNLRIMVSVHKAGRPLQREDPETELTDTLLRSAKAASPGEIDQVEFRKRNSETLLEYTITSKPRWVSVCGIRRLNESGSTYLIRIKVKERPQPAMSALLERIRESIATEFKILP